VNKNHQKLTRSHRDTIERMDKSGHDHIAIARVVDVHRTTIDRELRHNRRPGGAYEAAHAHALAVRRKARGPVKFKGELARAVIALQFERQSPAEICERLRAIDANRTVCAETIYRHTYADLDGSDMQRFLPLRRRKRKPRRGKRLKRGPIPDRVDIGRRPPEVAALIEHGHYEGDTVHGKDGAVVTLVERVSGHVLIARVANLKKLTVAAAVIAMTKGYRVRTITFDNGSEFADHVRITRRTHAKCYFATPGRPCERGRNENKNRQLRLLHPKGKVRYRHMRAVEVRRVQDRLNNKLRKGLGWKCANDHLDQLVIHGPPAPPGRA
jgi:IS30 family transposase